MVRRRNLSAVARNGASIKVHGSKWGCDAATMRSQSCSQDELSYDTKRQTQAGGADAGVGAGGAAGEAVATKVEFIQSSTWTGCKRGYIFATRNHGTGYYKDDSVDRLSLSTFSLCTNIELRESVSNLA